MSNHSTCDHCLEVVDIIEISEVEDGFICEKCFEKEINE